jgi:hypothetical protein
MKRSKTDAMFSDYIRERDNWTCQRCLVDLSNYHGQLDNSHFFGRGNKSTRWDEDNCISLCKKCHMYFGDKNAPADILGITRYQEYEEFMIKRLGQPRFDLLVFRAHQTMRTLGIDEGCLRMFFKDYLDAKKKQIIGAR